MAYKKIALQQKELTMTVDVGVKRRRLSSITSIGFLTTLFLAVWTALPPATAETAQPAPSSAYVSAEVRTVLSTGTTAIGETVRYPSGAPAQITAVEITLEPGQQTGWHTHPVPLFGYIVEGELTVDYGTNGQRTYSKGDGLVEAMNEAHNGRNSGTSPVKILAVFIGVEGVPGSAPASPTAR